ncbi:extracellular calcium-sensing receptor-like [Phyllobates terribilis]|uniref:extracellular calcium-sensing receptor-like n=1 Tax=Phyllobates terribilis TaxID=111132 RepID=UPI003CCB5407
MTLLFCPTGTFKLSCSLSIHAMANYTENGDIMLGMVNPVSLLFTQPMVTFSKKPSPRPCDRLNSELYKSILALVFASKEVNENPDLLPNITLGFKMFDSCFSDSASLQAIFQTMSKGINIHTDQDNKTCTGLEKVVTNDMAEFSDPRSHFVYMAHNAVYAIAHALHYLLHCRPDEGLFFGKLCADKHDIQPWQLLHYLKRVHFVNTAGADVSFDSNGDIYGSFDIFNSYIEDNRLKFLKVGTFKDYVALKLYINDSAISWVGGQVPLSVCSDVCPTGHRKMPRKGQPVCCFDCVLCPESMISTEKNSVRCFGCAEDFWSNKERTKCIPKVVEFLSYEEPLGLVMASLSIMFSFINMMVLIVFLKFRNTTVVKANNRNLSYIFLLSLIFCFLCSLVFIGCPVKLTCLIRHSLFGMIFSLCISCILAKTIIVVIAFKATKPGSNLRVFVGSKLAILVVSTSTCVQGIFILVWQIWFPPFLERNYEVLIGVILLECNVGSVVLFYSTIGYLAFLATISFVVAFLARNLPDSFNEAKYITFSMLTFLSVWLNFIPAYLSTKGKYIVAVEIFAILLSSFGLLCCIFGPKCYIIVLRPSMNTKQYLLSNTKKHCTK